MDLHSYCMSGDRRPAPRAADAGAGAARARAVDRLARAAVRLDGLYALLGTGDVRDAALLATLLAEELDAVAVELGPSGAVTLSEDRAALGPLPGVDALLAFANRAEAVLTRLQTTVTAPKAGAWRLLEHRFKVRALLALCVVFLAVSILLGDVMAQKRQAFIAMVTLLRAREKANIALGDLAKMVLAAKKAENKTLASITGENCTQCGCEGRDLRTIPEGDACRSKWDTTRARLGRAAEVSPKTLIALACDPWGSPYLLNENEGENLNFPCLPDTIASAGQNGIFGDADDLVVVVPHVFCPDKR